LRNVDWERFEGKMEELEKTVELLVGYLFNGRNARPPVEKTWLMT
jgi:hypothetical protein